jgi:hypothetical protein
MTALLHLLPPLPCPPPSRPLLISGRDLEERRSDKTQISHGGFMMTKKKKRKEKEDEFARRIT